MYSYEIKPFLQKILNKLFKKNRELCEQVLGKMQEIIHSDSIEHYKNLRYDLKDFKRVHIGHFVLVFSYNPTTNLISFEDFDHHDIIYNKRF